MNDLEIKTAGTTWHRPPTTHRLWPRIYEAARLNGLVLQRALSPGAEARRGRYFLRCLQSGGIVHSATELHELRHFMKLSKRPRPDHLKTTTTESHHAKPTL